MGLRPDHLMASPILGSVQPRKRAIKHVTSASFRTFTARVSSRLSFESCNLTLYACHGKHARSRNSALKYYLKLSGVLFVIGLDSPFASGCSYLNKSVRRPTARRTG